MAVLERLAFLHQIPLLLKGTSDDNTPCPGYLYEEIAKISRESPGSCQCLLEYLLNRLQSSSCHVKLKVLKILLSLCTHGSAQFVRDLRRNASYIQEAADVSGPPDPLHGVSLYQKVRATAQEVVGSLFSDVSPHLVPAISSRERPPTGMGSQASHPQALQGFGYSKEKQSLGASGDTLLGGIQRTAVAVSHAVMVGTGSPSPRLTDETNDSYKPVAVPAGEWRPPVGKTAAAHGSRVCHRSGVPGGGWDESDSGHSSQESSQGKSPCSQSSEAGSKSGSDGQSRGSNRENSEMTERAEPAHPGDCLQEAQLVLGVSRGNKVFLTQEEVQQFVRGCSLLNCEVVFEMLNHSLADDNECVKMRSLCAISSLMTSDLLSHDHMFSVVRRNLQKLSEGSPGPVTDKATKILRQFEALTQHSNPRKALSHVSSVSSSLPCQLDLLSDVNPQPGKEDILKPLSVPSSPTPASDTLHPVACSSDLNGVSRRTDKEGDASDRPVVAGHKEGRVSLFDGMEIINPLKNSDRMVITQAAAVTTTENPDTPTTEDIGSKPRLQSVFSFLNF
ncbi:AP-4 complex accessory subunit tepsin [Spea bombifrons]|uniref:AP-4 complex accessory subunit tepsin n=1 Tax=Spea bombifrons TaxID=233779 RepID=UPI00234AA7BB|nr:AP-4 complex accessory subunit tepsin [Spea bombifrons]